MEGETGVLHQMANLRQLYCMVREPKSKSEQ